MAEKPETNDFLASLDAKIAALQQLREGYVAALSTGAIGGTPIDVSALTTAVAAPSGTKVAASGPIDLPTGIFRSKGIADAIRIYLGAAKRKQTAGEISAALKAGGLQSSSADLDKIVVSTLYRLRDTGELLRFKDGWDLAADYPDRFRQLGQNPGSPKKSRKRKAARKKADAARNTKPNTKAAATAKQEAGTEAEGRTALRAV